MHNPFNVQDHFIHNKKTKPAILDWMAKKFSVSYEHSFRDQFISFTVWDGRLTIGLDFRVDSQKNLFDHIPDNYKGCIQEGTGNLVNGTWLYFNLDSEFKIEYPTIVSKKIVGKYRHIDNDGDYFYEYTWEVFLSDNSSILFTNQDDRKLEIEQWLLPTYIQERHLFRTLIK